MDDRDATIAALKSLVERFCTERDWDRFHGPKDLAVGVVTEAAELLELFRFRSDDEVAALLAGPERERVEHELADVTFFVLRLAERLGIDLTTAFLRKLELNAERYPVDNARGSNRKYTEL
jgi:NTP pyrophosphatase (non-canonical NTP hydrolase)